jgi:MFS family permease
MSETTDVASPPSSPLNDKLANHTQQNENDEDINLIENDANTTEVKQQQESTFELSQAITITVVLMCEAFAYTFLFPFVGFMIMDFGLAKDERDTGYYAGILTCSFAFSQFFSGFLYGSLSDRISKKIIVLMSMIGSMCTVIAFGFSMNFSFAIIVRLLNGALSGAVATSKAHLAEITDSSNQSLAYSLITVGWGIGAIAGPMVCH